MYNSLITISLLKMSKKVLVNVIKIFHCFKFHQVFDWHTYAKKHRYFEITNLYCTGIYFEKFNVWCIEKVFLEWQKLISPLNKLVKPLQWVISEVEEQSAHIHIELCTKIALCTRENFTQKKLLFTQWLAYH